MVNLFQLNHAYCELEKRITEHDTALASGFDRPELLVQVCSLILKSSVEFVAFHSFSPDI